MAVVKNEPEDVRRDIDHRGWIRLSEEGLGGRGGGRYINDR